MNKEEQIKLVHSTLLEEYKSLREEIVSTSESSRQILHFTILVIGFLISGYFLIIFSDRSDMDLLLLIVPFFFYSLILTQLKYLFFINRIGDYIRDDISPHIRKNLAELSDDEEESNFEFILNWESYKENQTLSRYKIFFLPITIADIGILFFIVIISVIVYFILNDYNNYSWFEYILILFNFIMFIYCIWWGYLVEHKAKKLTETPNS